MRRGPSKGAVLFVVLATFGFLVIAAPAFAAKQSPTFQFKSGAYSVAENQSPAAIAITRNPKGSGSVHFRTAGGTATGGADCSDPANDYVVVTDTTVTFSNQSQKTADVTICNNNNEFEGNETVILQLFNPSAGVSLGSKKEVTLTIVDDDPKPSLSINDNSDTEGNAEAFTVTTDAASSLPIQFNWSTQNGTATSPGDFSSQSGTEVIAAGPAGSTAVFNVTSNDDSVDEPTEFFNVVLSNVINASVADGTGKFTLFDDDAAPTLSISGASGDPSVTEGGNMEFVVSLSGPTGAPITFDFRTDENASPAANGEDNCTIVGADFDHAPTGNVISSGFSVGGPTSVTISRPTCDDTDGEADEKFRGIIENVTYDGAPHTVDGDGITDNDATGTIIDNDVTAVTIEFEAMDCGGPSTASSCGSYSEDGFDITTTDHWHDNPGQPTSDNALETGVDCFGGGVHSNSEVTLTRTGGGAFDLTSLDVESISGTLTVTPDGNAGNAVTFTTTGTKTFGSTFQNVTSVNLDMGTGGCVDIDNIVAQF